MRIFWQNTIKNLKTAMGAYYTPLVAVKFIVNAIDDILKADFAITDGLADASTVTEETPVCQRKRFTVFKFLIPLPAQVFFLRK
jgi:hypothetical protein